MRALLLDTTQQKLKVLPDSKLETCYRYIKTCFVDFAYRSIGGRNYIIVFNGDEDEENTGNKAAATAFNSQDAPVFFGNLIICKHDREGEDKALSDSDIKHICKNTKTITGGTGQYQALINVDCPVEVLDLPDADEI